MRNMYKETNFLRKPHYIGQRITKFRIIIKITTDNNESQTRDLENTNELSKTEGEQKKRRGRPTKRKVKTKGEKVQAELKKQKLETRESYNTRSKTLQDTSFSNFTQITEVPEDFEFPDIQDEFKETEKNVEKDHLLYCLFTEINKDPQTYKQALESRNKNEWLEAVKSEVQSIEKNEVWIVVERPVKTKEGK